MGEENTALEVAMVVMRNLKGRANRRYCPPLFTATFQATLTVMTPETLMGAVKNSTPVQGAMRVHILHQLNHRSSLYLLLCYANGLPRVYLMYGRNGRTVVPVLRAYALSPGLVRYFDEDYLSCTVTREQFKQILKGEISRRIAPRRFPRPDYF